MSREGWGTAVCIASGPSLTQADCEVVRKAQSDGRCRVIVINSTFVVAPWADVLYAGDFAWWMHYAEQVKRGKWQAFAGERWTCSSNAKTRLKCQHIQGVQAGGLSKNPGTIVLGGNSGHATVGLAVEFGARRVVLLGYDMQRTGNRSHHHGDHPRPLGNGNNFPTWVRRMGVLAKDAERRGIEIVNCTRATALTCFKRLALDEALTDNGDGNGGHEVHGVGRQAIRLGEGS